MRMGRVLILEELIDKLKPFKLIPYCGNFEINCRFKGALWEVSSMYFAAYPDNLRVEKTADGCQLLIGGNSEFTEIEINLDNLFDVAEVKK